MSLLEYLSSRFFPASYGKPEDLVIPYLSDLVIAAVLADRIRPFFSVDRW